MRKIKTFIYDRCYKKFSGKVLCMLRFDDKYAYGHWVFEMLPLLKNVNIKDIDYIYFQHKHHLTYQRESLQALGINETQIINADIFPAIKADVIYMPKKIDFLTNDLYSSIRWVKKSFSSFMTNESMTKKIYISRADTKNRQVVNDKEVQDFLVSQGFEIILSTRLSFLDQIKLFRSCAVVIGAHGSGLTNLVFCQKQCKVIEFFSSIQEASTQMEYLYKKVALYNKLSYQQLICATVIADKNAYPMFQNMRVDIQSLATLIKN